LSKVIAKSLSILSIVSLLGTPSAAFAETITGGATIFNENAHVNNLEEKNDSEVQKQEDQPEMKSENLEVGSWQSVVFGESTNANRFSVEPLENGVRLSSTQNGGKFQASGSDGLTYYYQQVPKDVNFRLSAQIDVESWTYTNGQEGFAVMLRDSVPAENSFGRAFFSNSFSILGSRIQYTWNAENQEVTNGNGTNYTMRLGLGSRTITGVPTGQPELAPPTGSVSTTTTTFETSAGEKGKESGSYNIMGNGNGNLFPATDDLTTFRLEMKKTNTGLEAYYYDLETGEELASEIMYDWEKLYQSESDQVYLGFAAARNMTIKVTDIDLTYTDPATDPPAKERPNRVIEPVYTVTSREQTGSSSHELRFRANADGLLNIKTADGALLDGAEAISVTANREVSFETSLIPGENNFIFAFTPDPNFPPEDYTVMADYDTREIKHSVHFAAPRYMTVYVTPEGQDSGTGSRQNPLSLRQALRYAISGQTIVLAGGTYLMDEGLMIASGVDGTNENPIKLIADNRENKRPVLDFNGRGSGLTHWGNHWIMRGFDVTNTAPMRQGLQVSGSENWIEDIHAYRNGNTGIQISGRSADPFEEWPANNMVKNCTSFENADPGFEDADGFAAKLTVGEGNVFDGCIAYHNADDGWDLFARNENGPIGKVVIKNSVAYRNGWVPGKEGTGNGNGFKMGGSSMPGAHELINSLAFENLAKGIDSNSGTNIFVKSSSSFNNQSYNVAFYTSSAPQTDFNAEGVLSFRTEDLGVREQIRPINQDETQIYGPLNYYWNENVQISENSLGYQLKEDWFVSLSAGEKTRAESEPITRYENGSINVHGLMQVKEEYRSETVNEQTLHRTVGANFDGQTSPSSEYPEFELAEERGPVQTRPTQENNPIHIIAANGQEEQAEENIVENGSLRFGVAVFTPYAEHGEAITGDARYTPMDWQIKNTNQKGTFDTTPPTAETKAPTAGAYALEVSYKMEVYDGQNWQVAEETILQEREIRVQEENKESAPTPEPAPDDAADDPNNQENNEHPEKEPKPTNNDRTALPKTNAVRSTMLPVLGIGCLVLFAGYIYKKKTK
jgi:LPXTG-motif cell wall-anchored protein